MAKPGKSLLELAEQIEKFIESEGGFPAFPVNLSANNTAAHFTPSMNDTGVVGESDVLKIDIGVHIDGYITDSALTVDFSGEHGKMLEAADNALASALSVAKNNANIGKIGEAIESAIKKSGYRPIVNLTGHGVLQWTAHAPPGIPNVGRHEERSLEAGFVYAIEPFATDGQGYVREGVQAEIFEMNKAFNARSPVARKVLSHIKEHYRSLPFAQRWVAKKLKLSEFNQKIAFRELLSKKCLASHPILNEEHGKTVAQAETTILVEEGKTTVLV
ncbi:MAG: type II methionyl aminopeptidase [archaeon]